MRYCCQWFVTCIVLAALAPSSFAAIIYSNSFEVADGYPAAGGGITGGPGVTATVTSPNPNATVADNANFNAPATSGIQYLVFNLGGSSSGGYFSTSGVSTINTINGATYTLTFQYGAFGGTPTGNQSILVTAIDSTSAVLLSQTVTDTTQTTVGSAVFSPYSFTFTGSGDPVVLKILDTTTGDPGDEGLFDNIQLSMPEPASIALLAGVGPLLLRRRN